MDMEKELHQPPHHVQVQCMSVISPAVKPTSTHADDHTGMDAHLKTNALTHVFLGHAGRACMKCFCRELAGKLAACFQPYAFSLAPTQETLERVHGHDTRRLAVLVEQLMDFLCDPDQPGEQKTARTGCANANSKGPAHHTPAVRIAPS